MKIKELRLTYRAEKNFPNLIVRRRTSYEGNASYSLLCRIRKLSELDDPFRCVNYEGEEITKAIIQFMRPIVGKNDEGYIRERVVDDIRPPCIRCKNCGISRLYKNNSQKSN